MGLEGEMFLCFFFQKLKTFNFKYVSCTGTVYLEVVLFVFKVFYLNICLFEIWTTYLILIFQKFILLQTERKWSMTCRLNSFLASKFRPTFRWMRTTGPSGSAGPIWTLTPTNWSPTSTIWWVVCFYIPEDNIFYWKAKSRNISLAGSLLL